MDPGSIRRALISVYDKEGIDAFAAGLAEMGVELLSSGGTARALAGAGLEVTDVSDYTGYPAMLGHRVVTLHPKVHGGILAVRDDPQHVADLQAHDIRTIDLVCVGVYPFEQVVARDDCRFAEAIEMIDIGGPTLIRAAAKNHRYVTVLTHRGQYARVLDEMRANSGAVSEALRQELAVEAFALTARYDGAVAYYLSGSGEQGLPDRIVRSYRKGCDLRYGENPHQRGAFYLSDDSAEACVGRATLLGGKEISFNNYYDANGAVELVKEFDEPCVAIIKHANPIGCAVDEDLVEAYRKAYFGDVNAAMGGIIAVNRPVTVELADAIVETYARWGKSRRAGGFYAEIVAGPSFEDGAVEAIRNRKSWGPNVRLLELGRWDGRRNGERAVKYVVGGLLVQDRDLVGLNEDSWEVVTRRKPASGELDDARFAWLVCKHVKSNAIALARGKALLGVGAGQMSRVNSAHLAVDLARRYGGVEGADSAGCAMASDAFFPFPDSLDHAAEIGATTVIQPGGAKKDAEVVARADELGLAMIFTHTRHFNH